MLICEGQCQAGDPRGPDTVCSRKDDKKVHISMRIRLVTTIQHFIIARSLPPAGPDNRKIDVFGTLQSALCIGLHDGVFNFMILK